MISLVLLTLPPSTNHLYGRGRSGVYLAERARRAKETIGFEALAQYRGKPLEGPLEAQISVFWGDKRRRDIDNGLKALLDALTGILWVDDSQIEALHILKNFDKTAPRVELSVSPRHRRDTEPARG